MKKNFNLGRSTHAVSHRFRGFTLLELLIVIAILVLLAALLLPAFARSREDGRRSTCMSNLQQIALAVQQYAKDNDARYPLTEVNDEGDPYGWADAVEPYLKNRQVFQCPSENTLAASAPAEVGFLDYIYNSNLDGQPETVFEAVSNTILHADGISYTARESADGHEGSSADCHGISGTPGAEPRPWLLIQEGQVAHPVATRHVAGVNYAFVDGHVKWLQPSSVWDWCSEPTDRASFAFRIGAPEPEDPPTDTPETSGEPEPPIDPQPCPLPDTPAAPTFSNVQATSLAVVMPALPANATSLTLERLDGGNWTTLTGNLQGGTQVLQSGLAPATYYNYRIRAEGACGSSDESESSVQTLAEIDLPFKIKLSGGTSPSTKLQVDDRLDVWINGALAYRGSGGIVSGRYATFSAITFTVKNGDVMRIAVRQGISWYGSTPLYLHRIDNGLKQKVHSGVKIWSNGGIPDHSYYIDKTVTINFPAS